jgi:chromosome segregation ATPase
MDHSSIQEMLVEARLLGGSHIELCDCGLEELPSITMEMQNTLKVLNLRGNALKSLPDSFSELIALEKLILWNNRVEVLPESIGGLKHLLYLDCLENRLTSLPESVGSLHKLTMLDISHNLLSSLPSTMGDLVCLEKLVASNNELTSLPMNLGSCQALRCLDVRRNKLTSLPPSTGSLYNLRVLDVGSNLLHVLPLELCQIESLEDLDVDDNPLRSPPLEVRLGGTKSVLSYLMYLQSVFDGARTSVSGEKRPLKEKETESLLSDDSANSNYHPIKDDEDNESGDVLESYEMTAIRTLQATSEALRSRVDESPRERSGMWQGQPDYGGTDAMTEDGSIIPSASLHHRQHEQQEQPFVSAVVFSHRPATASRQKPPEGVQSPRVRPSSARVFASSPASSPSAASRRQRTEEGGENSLAATATATSTIKPPKPTPLSPKLAPSQVSSQEGSEFYHSLASSSKHGLTSKSGGLSYEKLPDGVARVKSTAALEGHISYVASEALIEKESPRLALNARVESAMSPSFVVQVLDSDTQTGQAEAVREEKAILAQVETSCSSVDARVFMSDMLVECGTLCQRTVEDGRQCSTQVEREAFEREERQQVARDDFEIEVAVQLDRAFFECQAQSMTDWSNYQRLQATSVERSFFEDEVAVQCTVEMVNSGSNPAAIATLESGIMCISDMVDQEVQHSLLCVSKGTETEENDSADRWEEIAALNADVHRLTTQNGRLEDERKKLLLELDSVKNDLTRLSEKASRVQSEHEDLMAENTEARRMEWQVNRLQVENEMLSQQVTQMKEAASQAVRDDVRLVALEEEKHLFAEKVTSLNEEIKSMAHLRQEYNNAMQKITELECTTIELTHLRERVGSLSKELETSREYAVKVSEELLTLKSEYSNLEVLQLQLKSLEGERDTRRSALEQMQQQLNEALGASSKYQLELRKIEDERTMLIESVSALEEEKQSLKHRLHSLEETISGQELEFEQSRRKMASFTRLEEELAVLKESHSQLGIVSASTQQENARLESLAEVNQKELEALKSRYSLLESDTQKELEDYRAIRKEHRSLQNTLDEKEAELVKQEATIAKLEESLQRELAGKSDLMEASRSTMEYKDIIARLEHRLELAEEDRRKAGTSMEEMLEKERSMDARVAGIEQELARSEFDLEQAKRETETARGVMSKLEKDNQALTQDLEAAQDQVAKWKSAVAGHQKRIRNVSMGLVDAREELQYLRKSHVALMEATSRQREFLSATDPKKPSFAAVNAAVTRLLEVNQVGDSPDLARDLEAVRQELSAVRSSLREKEEALAACESSLEAMTADRQKVVEELETFRQEAHQTQDELQSKVKQLETSSQKQATLLADSTASVKASSKAALKSVVKTTHVAMQTEQVDGPLAASVSASVAGLVTDHEESQQVGKLQEEVVGLKSEIQAMLIEREGILENQNRVLRSLREHHTALESYQLEVERLQSVEAQLSSAESQQEKFVLDAMRWKDEARRWKRDYEEAVRMGRGPSSPHSPEFPAIANPPQGEGGKHFPRPNPPSRPRTAGGPTSASKAAAAPSKKKSSASPMSPRLKHLSRGKKT